MEMSDKPEIHHKRKISPIQQQTVIPADFLSRPGDLFSAAAAGI